MESAVARFATERLPMTHEGPSGPFVLDDPACPKLSIMTQARTDLPQGNPYVSMLLLPSDYTAENDASQRCD